MIAQLYQLPFSIISKPETVSLRHGRARRGVSLLGDVSGSYSQLIQMQNRANKAEKHAVMFLEFCPKAKLLYPSRLLLLTLPRIFWEATAGKHTWGLSTFYKKTRALKQSMGLNSREAEVTVTLASPVPRHPGRPVVSGILIPLKMQK